MKRNNRTQSEKKALAHMRRMGATIRASQAIEQGIHPRTLYKLHSEGALEKISRGIYRLADKDSISDPDLITVASRAPHAVVCLISALSFHHITTQIPRKVSIAVLKDSRVPKIDWPPISVHKFSPASFTVGIEKHLIDEIPVQIYDVEKTLVDCFKFRNKIGMDIVLEALRYYKERKKCNMNKLYDYAKICRVKKAMMPYLEAML